MKSSSSRKQMMLYDPVEKVIPKLAVPTIISMLITSIYNMADTYFVSQIGTSASGAVGVTSSAMSLMQAVAYMIGIGSGINMSKCLGQGDEEKAKQFVTTGLFTAFGVGLLITVFGNLFMNPIVMMLGATETIAPYAKAYSSYIFYAAPFMMTSFAMNNLLRYQGLALYGMVGIATGGILNILLDPLFIFTFELGTAGAAIATALSQVISFLILLFMTMTRKETIKLHPKYYRFDPKIYGRIIYNGMPSLGRQGLASVSIIVINHVAGIYGDAAIAAFNIVNRFVMFINSSVIGFGQGFQPVCSFCYGAKKFSRVRHAFWYCVKVTTVMLIVFSTLCFPFARQIVTLFIKDDLEVIRIGTLALRLQLCALPLWGFTIMASMFTQSIGYGVRATLLSTARQGMFLLPMLLILPPIFDVLGIQMARPVADIFTLLLSILVTAGTLKKFHKLEDTEEATAPG